MLWSRLRRRLPDQPAFRNQHPLGPYILDFYCAAAKLAVEIDGAGHSEDSQEGHDQRRDYWLSQQGMKVYRVAASAVYRDLNAVADGVRRLALALVAERASGATVAPSTIRSSADGPPPPLRGGGKR
jgi:very-short-patch-repair endonuclease